MFRAKAADTQARQCHWLKVLSVNKVWLLSPSPSKNTIKPLKYHTIKIPRKSKNGEQASSNELLSSGWFMLALLQVLSPPVLDISALWVSWLSLASTVLAHSYLDFQIHLAPVLFLIRTVGFGEWSCCLQLLWLRLRLKLRFLFVI